DLNANEIIGVVQSPAPSLIYSINPLGTNDDKQHRTFLDLIVEVVYEVHTKGDIVHIFEDVALTKVTHEPIINTTTDVVAISATVRDKDFMHTRRALAGFGFGNAIHRRSWLYLWNS